MHAQPFTIAASLGMPRILEACRDLNSLPAADDYIIDFSRTQHFEPLGMLLIGSAIRRLRERCARDDHTVTITGRSAHAQGHRYAHRLGFWWSIGDEEGLPAVKRTATNTTIPITRLSYAELFKEAGRRDPIRAELVSKAAGNLATTLSGADDKSPLWLILEYCFREVFRNTFEHGRTDSIWFTGATRPTKNDVQIAILDSGRGIRDSLSDNPQEQHPTDIAALRAALRPGVSRNANKLHDREMLAKLQEEFPGQDPLRYDNSGFGLTLTSILGRDSGQFAIISGSASLAYCKNREIVTDTLHNGTAVRIVLYLSKLDDAFERALEAANRKPDGTPRSHSLITASMMTRLGLPSDIAKGSL